MLAERVTPTVLSSHVEPDRRLYVGGHFTRIAGEPFAVDWDRMYSAAHLPNNVAPPAVRLWIGGQCGQVQGEVYAPSQEWPHMFTAKWPPSKSGLPLLPPRALLDSGAFSDSPRDRLTPEGAVERQLTWERLASERWGMAWQASGLVSYDLLIDETWAAGTRHKRRWTVSAVERAVRATVDAAAYLASQRERLEPRRLILSAQGVDPQQYSECAAGVLNVAQPQDWFGLGGWCILGRHTRLLPTLHQTLYMVLPMVKAAGLSHVHIFGVMYRPALGALLWLADRHGLTVSTDSTAPVLACTWKDSKKAGVKMPHWRDNVQWWLDELASLRDSRYYRRPPESQAVRQLSLLEEAAP